MATRIGVLRSMAEIEAIRLDWMRLQWHPNSDLDSYCASMRSLPNLVSPYVLVVFREGTPAVLVVGRIEESRLNVRIGYATVPGPRARELVFIYGGVLGEPTPAECESLVESIVHSLRTHEADLARFNHLRADCALYERFTGQAKVWCRDHFPVLQTHRVMSVPHSEGEFWGRFSPKVRKNLKWQANRFEREYPGGVQIRCLKTSAETDSIIADIEQIAAKTYQRGLGVGFNASVGDDERLRLKAAKGWLRAYILYVNDIPCAFWCVTSYDKMFHSDSMGYDPLFQKFSPGIYLLIRVMGNLFKEEPPVEAVDFGLGDAEYKRHFGDQHWQDGSVCRFAPTLSGALLNAYRTPLVFADRLGRKLLSGGLEGRIKKIWRRYATRQGTKPDSGGNRQRGGEPGHDPIEVA